MSILIANDGSRVVNTISERNAIAKRFPGMEVTVNDATGDPEFGGGVVQYQWEALGKRWVPIWSDRKPDLKFATEEKVINGGQVKADHPVKDQKVWSALIIDSETGLSLGDAIPVVTVDVLDIGNLNFEGQKLRYTYAYGSMSAQMTEIWEQKVNQAPSDDADARFLRKGDGTWQKLEMADPERDMAPQTTVNDKPVTPQGLESFMADQLGIRFEAETGDWVLDEGLVPVA